MYGAFAHSEGAMALRGLVYGLLFSIPLWIMIVLLVWKWM